MKVDGGLSDAPAADVEQAAAELEQLGYDGIWSAETDHDPFLPLALAARRTTNALLGTSIAVAFARNPMTLAYLGNDLQSLSQGRFVLGLGSQVRAHITKRFSMPWSHPAARMREMVSAIRAIWRAWETGERVAFRGDFYTHTLMTPFFSPGPNRFGNPRVFLAAVGPHMTEVAGEVADGLLVHGFTTERYLREVTLPAVERGLARSGRTRADFELSYPAFVVTGDDERRMAEAAAACKKRIAFYASTPAYLPVLERHGWAELGHELNRLSKTDDPKRWDRMGDLVDDGVMNAFAVVAAPGEVAGALRARFDGVVDRVSFSRPFGMDARGLADVVRELRSGTASAR